MRGEAGAGLVAMVLSACATVPAGLPPLTSTPGDALRGREIVISRDGGHCILCHAVAGDDVKFAGNIAPPFAGVGKRLSAADIRQRVVDITAVRPGAVMPAFHRTENLARVAEAYRGKPILSAEQVEDVVAYLASLKE